MSASGLGQKLHYAIIAALCAALHFAVMMAGDALGCHFAVSVTVSFAACVIVGFLLHCRFTFAVVPQPNGLLRYTAAMALNYPLTLWIIWVLHEALGLAMLIAAPASTLLLTVYNFLSSRWAVSLGLARQMKGTPEP